MAESAIPVDLLNPGQVFACIGFIEAADMLLGDAEGIFDWSDSTNVQFRIRAQGQAQPVPRVLKFLDGAEARAIAPAHSTNLDGWNDSWGDRPIAIERGRGYPIADPDSPATLACHLSDGAHTLTIDHWGDATMRDNIKFWAGAGGYPGAGLARDALSLIRGRVADAADDPFACSAPQSSSFRLDWRRDYIPIHAGFSVNRHGNMNTVGFPLVELLGAIGLSNARPRRPDRRNKLLYEYAVIGRERTADKTWLPPAILRAALGAAIFPFPMRRFRMLLDWPGKEGQARSITTVTEESNP